MQTLRMLLNARILVLSAFFSIIFSLPLAAQKDRTESYRGRDVVSGEILVKFRGVSAVQSRALASRDADIFSIEYAGQTGAILIRSRGRNVDALLQEYMARPDVEYAEPNYIWHTMDVPNDVLFG